MRIIKLRNKWLYSVSNIQKKKNNHVWIKILFVDQFWNKYIKWFGKQNMRILDLTAIHRSFVKTVSQLKICWFFRRKGWKVLKRYNFLWVQRRHDRCPAASFTNCVMTLYLLKVHLQTFLSIHSFISIQPLGRFLAGTRTQSSDWYGSGTLHPGQILRCRLPLLSPAFRRSHLLR